MKTTKEDFAAYKRWQKYILGTYPELPGDCKRPTLIAYALAMAIHGTNGIDCFASDGLIGKKLGLTNRGTVAKYRHLAVRLGWFAPSGKRHGRSEGLNISVPSESGSVPSLAVPGRCEQCEPDDDYPTPTCLNCRRRMVELNPYRIPASAAVRADDPWANVPLGATITPAGECTTG